MLSRATLPEVHRAQGVGLNHLLSRKRGQAGSIVCVSARPGDEVISMGGSIVDWQNPRFIDLTDGSPQDLDRVLRAGFDCRDEFARARKRDFENALHRAGLEQEHMVNLGYEEGEISENLAAVAISLAAALHDSRAEVIITHPYEGTHPDLDATAFAVQCACALLENDGISAPTRIEAAGCHQSNGELVIGKFLTEYETETVTIRLDTSKQQLKRSMIECLATQPNSLQGAEIRWESFRIAPLYDFTRAPREGILEYERNDSSMSGRRWRRLAAEALRVLGLEDRS